MANKVKSDAALLNFGMEAVFLRFILPALQQSPAIPVMQGE